MQNKFRHELKYLCSGAQMDHLQHLLSGLLIPDSNQIGNAYRITSLYFDTESDRFLAESLNGNPERKKYRLRRYNSEINKIKFEQKSSFYNLKNKKFIWGNKTMAYNLLSDTEEIPFSDNRLLEEFYCLKKIERVTPKIVISYDRTAFTDLTLDIRITLDKNISYSNHIESFFDNSTINQNFLFNQDVGILEVKYDSFLPDYVQSILKKEDLTQTSFSKYVNCRTADK